MQVEFILFNSYYCDKVTILLVASDQGMGWKDPLETEKRDWQVFGGERDMKSRDVNQRDRDNKDNRGKPDNNGQHALLYRYANGHI